MSTKVEPSAPTADSTNNNVDNGLVVANGDAAKDTSDVKMSPAVAMVEKETPTIVDEDIKMTEENDDAKPESEENGLTSKPEDGPESVTGDVKAVDSEVEEVDSPPPHDSASPALQTAANNSNSLVNNTPTMVAAAVAPAISMAAARAIMLDQYTPWVMSTYGDSAKTKTITARKYARIVALLKSLTDKEAGVAVAPAVPIVNGVNGGSAGGEPTGSEAAKFRLWVKSKGFCLGPPAGHPESENPESRDMLYLPTGTDKVSDYESCFPFLSFSLSANTGKLPNEILLSLGSCILLVTSHRGILSELFGCGRAAAERRALSVVTAKDPRTNLAFS